jgi:membrane protein
MRVRDFFGLMKIAAWKFQADSGTSHSAAIAYYAAFSLSPLLLLVVGVVGHVLGPDAAKGEIVARLRDSIGGEGTAFIERLLTRDVSSHSGLIAGLVSVFVLLIGASGVFTEIQGSLNAIWKVPGLPSCEGWFSIVRRQLLAILLIGGSASLVLISFVATAVLAAADEKIAELFPVYGAWVPWGNLLLNIVLTTVLFAMIFQWLPDVRLHWRDVWTGAVVTALMFSCGGHLIGLYLGKAAIRSTYGAAGSFVGILVWLYYSAQIFLFGAELTFTYAQRSGSKIRTRCDHEESVALPPPRVERKPDAPNLSLTSYGRQPR